MPHSIERRHRRRGSLGLAALISFVGVSTSVGAIAQSDAVAAIPRPLEDESSMEQAGSAPADLDQTPRSTQAGPAPTAVPTAGAAPAHGEDAPAEQDVNASADTSIAESATTTDTSESDDPWAELEAIWSDDVEPDEDPFAQFDEDFDIDWDEYTLDTIYFADAPANFSRFDLEDARGKEEIDTREMQERGARNLEEAITNMTPWSPLPSTGASPGPLLIDGLGGSWVQVLIDGIPYTRTSTGRQGPYPDLGNIPVDPRHLERVEIYRGSGPSGTCGSSGVILNMITKNPTQRYSGSVTLDGGVTTTGLSRFGARADLTIPIGDAWAIKARGGWSRHLELDVTNDGLYDRPRRTVDDAEVQALWRPRGEDRLTIGLRTYGTQQWNIDKTGGPGSPAEDRTDSRGFGGDIRYRTPDENENRFTLRLSAQHLSHLFYKYARWSGIETIKAETDSLALRGNLSWEREFGDHTVSTELCSTLDIVERSGESGTTPRITEPQLCVGANDIWRISDRFTLEASALGGYHAAMGPRWSGGLAGVVRINEQHGLRASFDAGQRVPTVEERYIDFDHSELGYMLQGNEDLQAEQAFSGRLGWVAKTEDERFGGEVSAYVTLLRNRIEPILIQESGSGSRTATYSYINSGRGLSIGMDAVFRAREIGGWFGFDLSYNALPYAQDPDTKAELSLRSHHNARLSLRGTWLNQRLTAWTSAGLRSRLLWSTPPGEVPGLSPTPPDRASFLWDAGVSGSPHESIWLGLTARNIAHDVDPLWGPMPGFELLFTVQATLDGRSR